MVSGTLKRVGVVLRRLQYHACMSVVHHVESIVRTDATQPVVVPHIVCR